MKKYTLCLLFISSISFAQQKETFDIATYTAPPGWDKIANSTNVVGYSVTDKGTGTYCQVALYASTNSKGSLRADFESEWQDLVVKISKPSSAPQLTPAESRDG